eukprot:TRINITY_DN15857_c0_g1_i1.p1 TRINITY_DN15857_c0_g1~~TRINITY_DN15857_c0_g1_i1.p1  ORF type:complete len:534 (+),score=96.14 TRINITY_DN15857_c0_g1_i1:115-1716(+)
MAADERARTPQPGAAGAAGRAVPQSGNARRTVFHACAAGAACGGALWLLNLAGGTDHTALPPPHPIARPQQQQQQQGSGERLSPPSSSGAGPFQPHPTGYAIPPCPLPFPNSQCQMVPQRKLKGGRPSQWLGCPDVGRQWDAKARVMPISFSMPESLLVDDIPPKEKDCPDLVPGGLGSSSHRFINSTEGSYYQEYRRSRYCVTYKKAGFDCMRHYEIIFNGCMPFFLDLEYAYQYSVTHLPRSLLLEARDLPGVSFNCTSVRVEIDHSIFPVARYEQLLRALLAHAREHLTTKAMARHALRVTGNAAARKVLWLRGRGDRHLPYIWWGGYLDHLLLHGFRTLLGINFIDTDPDMHDFLYEPRKGCCNRSTLAFWENFRRLYGKGFTYAGHLSREESARVNREDIDSRLKRKEFDVVVLPVHRGHHHRQRSGRGWTVVNHLPRVVERLHGFGYKREQIVYLIGEDQPNPKDYVDHTTQRLTTILAREIADCEKRNPVGTRGERLRQCVAQHLLRAEADWREQKPFPEMRWLLK